MPNARVPARFALGRYALVASSLIILIAASIPGSGADGVPAAAPAKVRANYELASRWTPAKVGKLVFDLAVTPHWLEGDRFWYSFENSAGRKFYLVDPAKKTKSQVYDPTKLAAALTTATGIPYDSQHLPITTLRFVKGEQAIQFEINVPRDATIPGEKKTNGAAATTDANNQQNQDDGDNDGGALDEPQQQQGGRGASLYGPAPGRNQKQLVFEYQLAANKLTLLEDRPVRKPAWASISPDDKTIVFARNHNLYVMDAANYAKALKNANDASIQETQLSTDGVEDFGYGGRGGAGGQDQQEQQQQQQNEQQQQGQEGQQQDNTRTRQLVNVAWSRDSKKFAITRNDS